MNKMISEHIVDVGYKVVLYGETIKARQDLVVMDHAKVKGKQVAWR